MFRSTTPKYATEKDLLSGAGSKKSGGRWNPVGYAVVYASLTPETAMLEALSMQRYFQLPLENAMPRTFVAIEALLTNVLDLRIGSVRHQLGVSRERMRSIDWRSEINQGREPITQTLTRAAMELKFEGMVVPSAADLRGSNLLVFPEQLLPGSTLQILHADRLR